VFSSGSAVGGYEQVVDQPRWSDPRGQRHEHRTIDPHDRCERARIDGPVLVALAARVGPTRLIDNLTVSPDGAP